jgi:hypothetical protein
MKYAHKKQKLIKTTRDHFRRLYSTDSGASRFRLDIILPSSSCSKLAFPNMPPYQKFPYCLFAYLVAAHSIELAPDLARKQTSPQDVGSICWSVEYDQQSNTDAGRGVKTYLLPHRLIENKRLRNLSKVKAKKLKINSEIW